MLYNGLFISGQYYALKAYLQANALVIPRRRCPVLELTGTETNVHCGVIDAVTKQS